MARRWTLQEEREKRRELYELYVSQNFTIHEIGTKLKLSYVAIYGRLIRLGIQPMPKRKPGWIRYVTSRPIHTPPLSSQLSEFCGILLGDGNLSKTQVCVTVNARDDRGYEYFVASLLERLFHRRPGITRKRNDPCVYLYIGSVRLLQFLRSIGIYATNKVKEQVDAPKWIFRSPCLMRAFIRGFFDTDGSVYRLRFGVQMNFTNRAMPLLQSVREMLIRLGFRASEINGYSFYLTRRIDLKRYYEKIGTHNPKHLQRFQKFGIPSFTLERTWKI